MIPELVGKIPWRREWQPTPVFFPGESHGPRSLVGYSPRGRKELDTAGRRSLPPFTSQQVSMQPGKRVLSVKEDEHRVPGREAFNHYF